MPTVLLASEAFEHQALYEAARLGTAALRLVVIPHPFGSLTVEAVDEVAASVVEDVAAALTSGGRPWLRAT